MKINQALAAVAVAAVIAICTRWLTSFVPASTPATRPGIRTRRSTTSTASSTGWPRRCGASQRQPNNGPEYAGERDFAD